MGFYLRKSISLGGVRFNLSKSGVGMSVGVKGFRVGTGPKGNYVHMGRHGLYYRMSLDSKKNQNASSNQQQRYSNEQPEELNLAFKAIETENVSKLVDATSEDLLKEINEKNTKILLWPFCLLAAFIYPPVGLFLGIILALLIYNFVDKLRKGVILMYDIDEHTENNLQLFYDSFEEMKNTRAKWNINAEAKTNDYKYNSGASSIVKRAQTSFLNSCPNYVKSNVEIPCILLGKRKLYFFPDRVLAYDGTQVGAVSYNNLEVSVRNQRFIESGVVPSDATIVDYTWQYLNKNGTPDKRFSNNRKLPILLYSEIDFTSSSGLNERIQLSKSDVGEKLAKQLMVLNNSVNFNIMKDEYHN